MELHGKSQKNILFLIPDALLKGQLGSVSAVMKIPQQTQMRQSYMQPIPKSQQMMGEKTVDKVNHPYILRYIKPKAHSACKSAIG